MVEYITGINGVGKTRIMCEACINTAAESKGNVIFIDVSDKLSTRLPSNIRLINVSDFGIEKQKRAKETIAIFMPIVKKLQDDKLISELNEISINCLK